uniref:Hypothetical chloroplast RF66 n=1 Tax=Chaetosphaeridium globosum TaxID=96477 RepID=Q8MA14_CHAGL|nr:hypothetical chloroplast RF66 [Chaetosphaeridium globosum]AAM96586.1 hypothetical chloroplast RF66 [Chaetosphaeridium globosum]
MIHMEIGPSTFVGICLIIMGIILYLLKTQKPEVSKEYDLLFSSIGLLSGGILIFQGWRLDPILLLCQILCSGTAIFFVLESLYLRNQSLKYISKQVQLDKKVTLNTTIKLLTESKKSDINIKYYFKIKKALIEAKVFPEYTNHISYDLLKKKA